MLNSLGDVTSSPCLVDSYVGILTTPSSLVNQCLSYAINLPPSLSLSLDYCDEKGIGTNLIKSPFIA